MVICFCEMSYLYWIKHICKYEQLLYSVSMFIWIDNGKYITAITKSLYVFSLFGKHRWFSIDTENDMDTENDFESNINNILRILLIYLIDFLDLISSK